MKIKYKTFSISKAFLLSLLFMLLVQGSSRWKPTQHHRSLRLPLVKIFYWKQGMKHNKKINMNRQKCLRLFEIILTNSDFFKSELVKCE